MSELLVVVVVLCHSRVLGLSSSIILRTNNRSHPVLKHTKDQSIYGNYKLSDPRLAASRIITNYTFSLTKVTTSRASPPDRLGCCRTPQPWSSHQTMIVYRPHNGGGETPATGSQMRPDEGSADHPNESHVDVVVDGCSGRRLMPRRQERARRMPRRSGRSRRRGSRIEVEWMLKRPVLRKTKEGLLLVGQAAVARMPGCHVAKRKTMRRTRRAG